MKEENRWLEFALDDLDSGEIMYKAGKYNMVCFFAHQAAEKALKAFLVSRKQNPPRIHNIVDLVNLCASYNKSFSELLPKARILNQFYIPTRYPTALPGSTASGIPDNKTAEKAINFAKEIVSFCKNSISGPA
ncbi:MAG: HEPN domain-containing protein [Thermosediminibacteraceae bacterium]|nr:HEPN domain-containing protein [Thermosediminibacteraceae bacterium]